MRLNAITDAILEEAVRAQQSDEFDSHDVIFWISRNCPRPYVQDLYLALQDEGDPFVNLHSAIGKRLAALSDLVQQQHEKRISPNVRGERTECEQFWSDYFIQTRKEIDTEKQERDKILNYAFVVMGAIGFAVAQNEKAQTFLRTDEGLYVAGAALVILSSLFWIRRKKLQQIADRWFVLHHMLRTRARPDELSRTMEGVVVEKLPTWTYIIKDVGLNFALALPIYILFILQVFTGAAGGSAWRIVVPSVVIAGHLGVSLFILGRSLKNPLEGLEETDLPDKVEESENGGAS